MTTLATRIASSALLAVRFGAIGALSTLLGCEVIASVDRSKIPSGTGGGSTSTSTTTSAGGAGTGGAATGDTGGTAACMQASDCPGKDTACQSRVCNMGVCDIAYQPKGMATPTQTAGTCQQSVCDGAGNVMTIPDDANVPVDGNPCTDDLCSNGAPSNPPFAAGAMCADGADGGGKVCDGSGHCVACTMDSDCSAGVCAQGMCVSASCTDHMKDGAETDVDCGGGTCPACALGLMCMASTDCASLACLSGVCATPSCTDTVQDGTETDVDCGGGACPGCAVGKKCLATSDCLLGEGCDVGTKTCDANACNDGIQNGNETDVDCGGGTCGACALGKKCKVDADCPLGGGCDVTTMTCDADTCHDGIQNGSETDVDCGGSCGGCAVGKKCFATSDCLTSEGCDVTTKTCDANTCSDGIHDGGETDVDCGGGVCPACANLLHCGAGSDCQSGVCTGGACQAPSCSDGVQNEDETSVDCGGVCGTCTVLALGAGVASTVGGEFHPGAAWATSSTPGGMSVDGLALTFVGGSSSALGLMRFTKLGDPSDNAVQWTTWTPGAWTAFGNVGAGITTSNAPTVGAQGATALGAFRGFDDNYYYATFSGGAWSGALPVQPPAGGQSSGPQGPSFDAATGTLAFGGDNQHLFAQTWSGTAWGAAQDLDGTNLTSLPPTVVGVTPLYAITMLAEVLVYVRASDGQLFYVTLTGSLQNAWSAPAPIAGAFTGDPVALAAVRDGTVVLAFRGQDGNLYTSVFNGSAWSSVSPFSTPNVTVASAPAITHGVGAAAAEIAFVESDGVAYHARLIGGAWTTPVAIGGSGLSRVTIASAP